MGEAADKVGRELTKPVPVIAEEIAERAREIARPHSEKVADSIKVEPGMPGSARIVAGGEGAEVGVYWETGSRGRARANYFVHPVFAQPGKDAVYVQQPRHRFLRPAINADRENIARRLDEAVDRGLTPVVRPE